MLTRGKQGKAKYNAWKNEVDDGVDAAAAQKKYIETVEKCKTEYGFDATRKTQADGKAIDSKKLSRFDELVKELGKTN